MMSSKEAQTLRYAQEALEWVEQELQRLNEDWAVFSAAWPEIISEQRRDERLHKIDLLRQYHQARLPELKRAIQSLKNRTESTR